MKPTFKDLTIIACKLTAKKYRDPNQWKYCFNPFYCEMCNLYYLRTIERDCKGCFLHDDTISVCGAIKFQSYIKLLKVSFLDDPENFKELAEKRAQFFDKVIPILKKFPAKQFTPSSWKKFKLPKHLK